MTTNTPPTDLRSPAEKHVHPGSGHPGSGHPIELPPGGKSKKRGLIWAISFVIIVAVGGFSVWRASQPGFIAQPGPGGRGGGGGGRGRGGLGPTPVQVARAVRKAVPVYLNGLGNVAAYYN